jgi:hypothetical protein
METKKFKGAPTACPDAATPDDIIGDVVNPEISSATPCNYILVAPNYVAAVSGLLWC